MKIGLIEVDGHKFPNLALMKLSAYHKQQGDEVEWATPFCHYNRIYMSKVFNYTPDDHYIYDADEIIKGGTGYDITSKLPENVERLQPDYSIYPGIDNKTAYGFLTRGCPNKCAWCVVPRKEGKIQPYMDVEEIAIDSRTNLVLMDNNILAAGDYALQQLEKILKNGYRVDFNQALDARLVNDRFAKLLSKIKWIDRRIRFGCDTHAQIEQCEKAISLINGYGYKGEYFIYTMLGGNNDFQECYERTHYWWLRNHELRQKHLPNIYIHSQPYRDPINPKHIIPQWQADMARWSNKKELFQVCEFAKYEPRKGFFCSEYIKNEQR